MFSAEAYLREILLSPVYELAVETPLQPLKKLSSRLGATVQLKREDLQPVHSFKLRGAYNKLVQLNAVQKQKGVIAASAGNHAQGVALSANKLGIKATIVMPTTTPDIKVESVRRMGGIVILHGQNFNEAYLHCLLLAEKNDLCIIPPFDDPHIIAGQGTIGKELLQQDPHLDMVFVPVGGGGLAAGVAVYIKQLLPSVKVIGVEAEDSACLKAALAAGKPVDLDRVGLFADGVAVKRIGDETFRLCQQYLDHVITVSTDEICAAVKDIFEDCRAIAEPSGALALAGLKRYQQAHPSNIRMAAILSGANVNFHGLRYVSERCELGEKKETVLAVTIPEQKGSFLYFCQLLGGRAITEFNYRYDHNSSARIFVGIRIASQPEVEVLTTTFENEGCSVVDLSDDEMAKLHVRYMVGGRLGKALEERIFSFEFPEHPGALLKFLSTLGSRWNITLFHYRNHGAAYGHVLVGFEVADEQLSAFEQYLSQLGFVWKDETDNPAYQFFLAYNS